MKLNILISYYYYKHEFTEIIFNNQEKINLIIDSGAFSAYNSKKNIDINNYNQFLFSLKKDLKHFYYVQLDEIFNPQKTKENFQRQLDAGLEPCPVFMFGEDYDYFFDLVEKDFYVFVGGLKFCENKESFAKFLMERTRDKKIHYFAFVNKRFIKFYNYFSCDSSSWVNSRRYKYITFFENGEILFNFKIKQFLKNDEFYKIKKYLFYLERFGLGKKHIDAMRKEEAWSGISYDCLKIFEDGTIKNFACYASILSYVSMAMEIEEKYKTKIYFAIEEPVTLKLFLKAFEELKILKKINEKKI